MSQNCQDLKSHGWRAACEHWHIQTFAHVLQRKDDVVSERRAYLVVSTDFIFIDDEHEVGDHERHEQQVLSQQQSHVAPAITDPFYGDDALHNLGEKNA